MQSAPPKMASADFQEQCKASRIPSENPFRTKPSVIPAKHRPTAFSSALSALTQEKLIALDRFHKIGDQIKTTTKLHVDMRPTVLYLLPAVDQVVIDLDDQRHDDDNKRRHADTDQQFYPPKHKAYLIKSFHS